MRKNIDIDETTLTKLKVLSVFEDMSVKSLMEKAVSFFVAHKESEKINSMTDEEKEDLGLLLLMQQADRTDTVSENEVMELLNKIQ
jgi:hypothetical protein